MAEIILFILLIVGLLLCAKPTEEKIVLSIKKTNHFQNMEKTLKENLYFDDRNTNSKLATFENLNNLGFPKAEVTFFADKYKDHRFSSKQITFDCSLPDCFLMLDVEYNQLYVYFEHFSEKQDPFLLEVGKLDADYLNAFKQVVFVELLCLEIMYEFEDMTETIFTEQFKKKLIF